MKKIIVSFLLTVTVLFFVSVSMQSAIAGKTGGVFGTKQVALILVHLTDASPACTTKEMYDRMMTGDRSVRALYHASSYGQLNLETNVGEAHIKASSSDVCDYQAWSRQASNAASGEYKIFIFPSVPNCPSSGRSDGKTAWMFRCSEATSLGHELGHMFGFGHSMAKDVMSDYGDHSTVMGTGLFELNAPHRETGGWLQNRLQSITRSGVYELAPLEGDPSVNAPQVLKILDKKYQNLTLNYYFSYRRPIGAFDVYLSPEYSNRLNVHRYAQGTPGSTTYIDSYGAGESAQFDRFTLTVIEATDQVLTFEITLNSGMSGKK